MFRQQKKQALVPYEVRMTFEACQIGSIQLLNNEHKQMEHVATSSGTQSIKDIKRIKVKDK